jgi:hypothetical protein
VGAGVQLTVIIVRVHCSKGLQEDSVVIGGWSLS